MRAARRQEGAGSGGRHEGVGAISRVLSTATFTVQLTGRIFHLHHMTGPALPGGRCHECLQQHQLQAGLTRGAHSASGPHTTWALRTLTCPARPAEATDRWMTAVTARGLKSSRGHDHRWALTAAPHVGDGDTTSERPHSARRNCRPQTRSARHRTPSPMAPHYQEEARWHRQPLGPE